MTSLIDRRQILLGAAALAMGVPARAHDGVVHVRIEKLAFQPASIEVKAGQTIEWENLDRMPHTATVKGGWEVMIPPGKKARKQAEASDNVGYFCRFHPNMKGKIRVTG